mgnify:CR=1 FL=1
MSDPKKYFTELSGSQRPAPFKIPEKIYPDIQWYNQNRASSRIFHPVEGIEGVVIHATAGSSTAGALNWWKKPGGGKASAHWIVPDEDEFAHGREVLAVVYESLAAWHVRNDKTHPRLNNKKKINHWTLGVEVVNLQNSSDKFSDWQLEITALLVRYCWAKYPNMKYVFSHAFVDPHRRSDPGKHFDWEKFIGLVHSSANDPVGDQEAMAIASAVSSGQGVTGEISDHSCCM